MTELLPVNSNVIGSNFKRKLKKIHQNEKLGLCFRGYIDRTMSVEQIAKHLKTTLASTRWIINQEKWALYREIFTRTGIFFPYTERHKYDTIGRESATNPSASIDYLKDAGADITKMAEWIKQEYVSCFPPKSIDTILSGRGLSVYIIPICQIAIKEGWHKARAKNQAFLVEQQALKHAYHESVISDLFLSYAATAIDAEINYLKGNPKVVTLKDENGNTIYSDPEKTVVAREIIRTRLNPNIVLQHFSNRNKQTININATNAQVNAPTGERPLQNEDAEDLQKKMKSAVDIYKEIISLKEGENAGIVTIQALENKTESKKSDRKVSKRSRALKRKNRKSRRDHGENEAEGNGIEDNTKDQG